MLESIRRFKAGMFRALAHPHASCDCRILAVRDKTVERLFLSHRPYSTNGSDTASIFFNS
jgi:hypothetical protein